jgi:hypothetical protein
MNYSLYDRIYETIKQHKFTSNNQEVDIDGVNTDWLVDQLMDNIKKHFNEAIDWL